VDEHSLHSPFFFDLYTKVLKQPTNLTGFAEIEKLRTRLLLTQTEIDVVDLGHPSPHFKSRKRAISQVAATSLAPIRLAQLLYRLMRHLQLKRAVELGTSMGVTSLYLAKDQEAYLHTFEGNPSMINIALTNFELFEVKNIELIEGDITKTLPEFLQTNRELDFVVMDANHRYVPTVSYFSQLVDRMNENGVIVIDDIYYSKEMARGWDEVRHHDLVYGSIDLFRCGLLFFDPSLNRQHYTCSW
jgi:predicted O-methyltransferase YrrM